MSDKNFIDLNAANISGDRTDGFSAAMRPAAVAPKLDAATEGRSAPIKPAAVTPNVSNQTANTAQNGNK